MKEKTLEAGKCYTDGTQKIRVAGSVKTLKCGNMLVIEEQYRNAYLISTIEKEAAIDNAGRWEEIGEIEFREALNEVGKTLV